MAITSSNAIDVPFTPQQKAFIMSLSGIDTPPVPNSDPVIPLPEALVTPKTIKTKVQAMMDIGASAPHRGEKWNYVEHSLFSKDYQKVPASDKFSILRIDKYGGTTDSDKYL